MPAPESYIEWINAHIGFNPRGQKNSNALSELVTSDLAKTDSLLSDAINGGRSQRLIAKRNKDVFAHAVARNIDLIFDESDSGSPSVPVAVENKTIMTAHGKAKKNRYGDIIAYCNHMHNHRAGCVAGAIVVINVSVDYLNPDSFAKGLKRPRFKMSKVVRDTIDLFASIPLRDAPDEPLALPEALAVIVVDYDGINPGTLVTDERAPQLGDMLHYGRR